MTRRRPSKKKPTQASPLPAYLVAKPDKTHPVPPPSLSREQSLPFSKLSWENFERLCKALVEADSEIKACNLYGRQGHSQHGIDLIAFAKDLADTRPRVYQCKRVEVYTAAQIKGAAKKFTDNIPGLRRKWKTIPSRFVLCCRCSLRSPRCQDEIVRQRTLLAKSGISFETWDEDELSRQLKDHSKIVDDFFEREWVRAFNGHEPALALSQRFALTTAQTTVSSEAVASLFISKDLEIHTLTTVLDQELAEKCRTIREDFKKGYQQKALLAIQSYLDRFDTDLHLASGVVRAKFWYTAGTLRWKLPTTRPQAKACLEKARQIDPSLDIRDLSARVLFEEGKFEEALQVLDPVNTQQVSTLKLALLLDLRKLNEFDALWREASLERDDVAYELMAYRQRLDRRFTEAQHFIQISLERCPGVPEHVLAAAHIHFWNAIPEHLDKAPRSIPPAWIHPLFYAPTASQAQLLEKAANFYLRARALILEAGPAEALQVREIEEFVLLCRAYHPLQRGQAQELAVRLLSEDPTVFTALFYCLEWEVPFDIDRSIESLGSKRDRHEASPNDLYVLAQLYERRGELEHAIRLMEAEKQRFRSVQEEGLWVELMSSLYVRGGQASKARLLREETAKDSAFSLRLQALEHDISGNYEEAEKAALEVWTTSQSLIDLVNLCCFYRKTQQWAKLEPLAGKLASLAPDPRNLWYLVDSLYRTHQYQQCLEVIEKNRSVWLEPSLLENIRRIEVECLIKLNRLDHAVVQLEAIRRERPSGEIVQRLAQAYFRLGRREQAVTVLREAVAKPDADIQLLIGTSQLLVHESPEEAFQLAQRATEADAQDPSIRMFYIETAFLTGHDREASESLRTFREQFPTSTVLESVAFSEAIQRMAAQQQVRRDRWELYRRAEAPVHVWIDIEHHPLGFDWYVRFESNLRATTWNKKLPIYAHHGSRGPAVGALPLQTNGILLDYTSLLLCHRLGLLPVLEQAFERIVLAPSTLSLIQTESLKAAQFQLSRIKISQVLKTSLDSGSIRVLNECPSDEALREFQLEQLGRADALLFFVAQQERSLVLVQQLAKEAIGQLELSEELNRLRVFPIEILTAMSEVGALAKQELVSLVASCHGQPCRDDRVQQLTKKPSLVLDVGTAEFFAHHGLIERLTCAFRIGIPKNEADHIALTLEEYRLRQEAAEWLDCLNRYLSERLNLRYFFPSVTLPDSRTGAKDPCTRVLEEVFYATRIETYPLWSDDRMVNRYAHAEGKPIVTIDAVLAFFKTKGLLSSEKYCEHLLKLMQLNVLFLPLNSEVVLHYLRLAGLSEDGLLRETYELKTIRRYVAYAFSQGTALHPLPLEHDKPSEAAAYFHAHREACREVLTELWTDGSLTEQYKAVASKWIVERLWKGIEDIAHLESHPLNPEAMATISQSLLIGVGLVMMFCDTERRGENAAAYLAWLYAEYLASHWESNPNVKTRVLEKTRQVIIGMVDKESGDRKKITLAVMSHVLATTSKDLSALVLEDEKVKSIFQGWVEPTVVITEDIKVPVKEWELWGFDAIAAGAGIQREVVLAGKKLTVQWHEPSIFTAGLGVLKSAPEGPVTTLVQSDPFLRLRHPSRVIREQALQAVVPYLDSPDDTLKTLLQRVASDDDRESLATEIEKEAEKSWTYFWERLKFLVLSQVAVHEEMAFPMQPEVFTRWLNIPSLAYKEQHTFIQAYATAIEQSIQSEGVQGAIAKVLGLPIGRCFDQDATFGKLLRSQSSEKDQIVAGILAHARTSSNPVILLNSLDALLSRPSQEPSIETEIKNTLCRLLALSDDLQTHRLRSAYKLYVTALRFAWCRMECLLAYRSFPVLQRMLWAYAYASGLTFLADDMRDHHDFEIDRESLAKWMENRIVRPGTAVFEEIFEEHLEVSHSMTMLPFRMTVSATLRILVEHKDNLANFGDDLLRLVIDTAKSIVQGTAEGGWEIYKPMVTAKNWFRAPWGHNAIASFKELLDGPLSDRLSNLDESDSGIIASIRVFEARSLVQTCLDRVITSGAWTSGDLLLAFVALSEPTDLNQTKKIAEAMQRLDLTRYYEEKDFQLACAVLARCVASTKDSDILSKALEKLTEAWRSIANEQLHYVTIMDSAIKICLSMGGVASFYSWWENTINGNQREIPTEVLSLVAGLAWTTPIADQGPLPDIRAKLGIL